MSDFVSVADMLAADHSGYGLRRLKDELFDMSYDVKRAMDAGLCPDDMAVARKVAAAVQAAEQSASKLYDAWNR